MLQDQVIDAPMEGDDVGAMDANGVGGGGNQGQTGENQVEEVGGQMAAGDRSSLEPAAGLNETMMSAVDQDDK